MSLKRHARPSRVARVAGALAALLAVGVAGCTQPAGAPASEDQTRDLPTAFAQGQWEEFGPFLRPEAFGIQGPGLPGPSNIFVDGIGTVHLSAAELIPQKLEGRAVPVGEVYSYTYDEGTPVIGGVVQFSVLDEAERGETDAGEGATGQHMETWLLGIDVGARAGDEAFDGARLLTATRAFSGPAHRVELVGRSDLGVIAVQLDGELRPEDDLRQQLAGIDVVRGTWVWARERGFAVYGVATLTHLAAENRESCAERIDELDVASGVARRSFSAEEYAHATGLRCATAEDPALGG